MADDLTAVLARFHRDVLLPDMERIVERSERRMRDEMRTLFDALSQGIHRLETEYQMLVAGLRRVEERLDRVEERLDTIEAKLDKIALRSDLEALKSRVDDLQGQIRAIESRL